MEINNLNIEEAIDYTNELSKGCSNSLEEIRKAMDNFNASNKNRIAKMEQLLETASSKRLGKKYIIKELTKIEKPFCVSVRILNTKLSSNGNQIIIDAHIAYVLVLDQLLNKIPELKIDILKFLETESNSIKNIASMCITYSNMCKSPNCETGELKRLFYNSSFIFLDYRALLLEISQILEHEIQKIEAQN